MDGVEKLGSVVVPLLRLHSFILLVGPSRGI